MGEMKRCLCGCDKMFFPHGTRRIYYGDHRKKKNARDKKAAENAATLQLPLPVCPVCLGYLDTIQALTAKTEAQEQEISALRAQLQEREGQWEEISTPQPPVSPIPIPAPRPKRTPAPPPSVLPPPPPPPLP
ncbi:hypothetical protein KIPB_016366, partial [Kipferlia bialata]|eukprot:g16366.t1